MSQDSDELTTQPTATALMERVREVELRLAHDIDVLANRFESQLASFREEIASSVHGQISTFRDEIVSSIQDQISSLREEMMKSFYKLNNRIITLTEDTLDMRANQREILKRLYDPEFTEKTP
ncbi:MAG TPA: hypothetical protein VNS63_03425 [Blastocatellia bacterium]|nr:hypothetical protein [Blastocatellia bacterium]